MFKLGLTDSYTWPVKIKLPTDEGKVLEQDFFATFKRLSQPEIESMFTDAKGGALNDVELVKKFFIGWKNIVDDSGNQLPFSEALRDQFLSGATIAAQVFNAFTESVASGKSKN